MLLWEKRLFHAQWHAWGLLTGYNHFWLLTEMDLQLSMWFFSSLPVCSLKYLQSARSLFSVNYSREVVICTFVYYIQAEIYF